MQSLQAPPRPDGSNHDEVAQPKAAAWESCPHRSFDGGPLGEPGHMAGSPDFVFTARWASRQERLGHVEERLGDRPDARRGLVEGDQLHLVAAEGGYDT